MSEASVVVRAAGVADVAALVDLHEQHHRYHSQFDARYQPRPRAESTALWHSNLSSDDHRILVAEAGGEVIALTWLRLVRAPAPEPAARGWLRRRSEGLVVAGLIVDLYVDEAWRRQGVGRALVAAAVAWFSGRGVREVEVGALTDNQRAVAFWQAMGFRPYRVEMRQSIA